MRELKMTEISNVSGGSVSTFNEFFEGMLWGLGDGAMTGMSIAGKFGGAGGWGFGALSQLVGYALTPIIGGLVGAIGGAIFGRDMIAETLADYRKTLG